MIWIPSKLPDIYAIKSNESLKTIYYTYGGYGKYMPNFRHFCHKATLLLEKAAL